MDVKIKDKDIFTLDNGDTVYIRGNDEIKQRVKFACTVKKGSFIYDRNFGAGYSIDVFSCDDSRDKLELLFNEAIVGIEDAYVNVNSISLTGQTYNIEISVNYKGKDIGKEVIKIEQKQL